MVKELADVNIIFGVTESYNFVFTVIRVCVYTATEQCKSKKYYQYNWVYKKCLLVSSLFDKINCVPVK